MPPSIISDKPWRIGPISRITEFAPHPFDSFKRSLNFLSQTH